MIKEYPRLSKKAIKILLSFSITISVSPDFLHTLQLKQHIATTD